MRSDGARSEGGNPGSPREVASDRRTKTLGYRDDLTSSGPSTSGMAIYGRCVFVAVMADGLL